ncbi:hypothetical protein [Draconibacterium halophilum]|uniref:DUF4402 domain-containing protein n=1 Tax=Draconibacterium halophilum TaxID=2706887 RepID=A0A6C0RIB0_9BACT|nr:hypothetical protein [Draconibacterium halophilum]QIA09786.1 hypothetical protein G0Q07_19675 [Draconibacterium halophilum]
MKYRISILIFFILSSFANYGLASDKEAEHKASVIIPDVALLSLKVEGNSNVEFQSAAPTTAGEKIDLQSKQESNIWLNYSSIVTSNQKRKITATVVGDIPNGISIKLKVGENIGAGIGELGLSNGSIVLSNSPVDIISGIGSCYTGVGVQNGHPLSYNLEIDENSFYSNSEKGETSVSVIYTLTDDN